jgi:DNA-directed RNA polymerase specialized sigma24 family protein
MTKRDPLASMDNDDWGQAIAEAVAIAFPFAPHDAEELVQNAVVWVLEGQAAWNPEEKSLALHLAEVGLDARSKRRRTERRRRRPQMMSKLVAFFQRRVPTPQELVFEKRRKVERFETLVSELAEDPDAQQIVRLVVEDDVQSVQEQADATGRSVEEVRNAHKRIYRRVEALDAREDKDETKSKTKTKDEVARS